MGSTSHARKGKHLVERLAEEARSHRLPQRVSRTKQLCVAGINLIDPLGVVRHSRPQVPQFLLEPPYRVKVQLRPL